MARLIRPHDWQPVAVRDLEQAALDVVRSTTHHSVVAGPGAGKTELLAQRACYLLQTEACRYPNRILAISFKRDAAKNLRDRVCERLEPELARRFESYTFDGFSKGLLDRFGDALPPVWRPTRDYVIWFPRRSTIPDFLAGLGLPPAEFGSVADVVAIPPTTFERDHVVGARLPIGEFSAVDAASWAAREFWKSYLVGQEQSHLTFPMIGRLAELLLRANPLIRRALLLTYSHVFLDEFQDTTHVQYDLLHTAFRASKVVLTAVGDMKQQIMRWAMALPNSFRDFERDFGAIPVKLNRNYRSSPALVRIQHAIACQIDPNCQESSPMVSGDNPEAGCSIKEFPSPQSEARYVAELIERGIHWEGLKPRDFVLLVKQKPEDYKSQLFSALRSRGLNGRDESELQDLLSERLTNLVTTFLRLGSAASTGPYWAECTRITANMRGLDTADGRVWRHFQRDLAKFQRYLYEQMHELAMSPAQVFSILRIITAYVDRDILRQAYPEYSQGNWFDLKLEELTEQLSQRIAYFGNWPAALDDFEGFDTVPLMTIHKSKGLEYHTVIFVGLDDSAWWSFRAQPDESRSAFFVAFSRAKHRILFTYCEDRGSRHQIASLYEILRLAGVASQYIDDQ